jgi:cyclic-di-GMP-binding protein
MSNDSHFPFLPPIEGNAKSILEWLAIAHGRTGSGDAEEIHQQLLVLRESATSAGQRTKLLDLLFKHVERVVTAELPALHDVRLPVSRKFRHRIGIIQELLETLIQEYFNTLSQLFDPRGTPPPHAPQNTLRLLVRCIGWHIRISHLVAAPTGVGIWQKLHAAYRTSRRLGLAETPGPDGEPSIQQSYMHILLAAIAQPASFCSNELEFITDYIGSSVKTVDIFETPPLDRGGVFWLNLEQDLPAQALERRMPPSDILALYFACDLVARNTRGRLAALTQGAPASSLGLPAFADTPAGHGVLRRLAQLWGQPAKRRYPRRRQSYRVNLCAGLEQLWQLIRYPEQPGQISEWMVTNESPEGYSLMHMAGLTSHLRVGDIVAVQPIGERSEATPTWHVGIVRWAISENPEHIELGMQQLASHAIAAEVIRPLELENGNLSALILPEMPPLRELPALVTPTGKISGREGSLILLIEQENFGIREVRTAALTEQTSSIEVFSVEPDEES